MIDLITYIHLLLAIAFVAMFFIIVVIMRQLALFKIPMTDPTVRRFRVTLFLISMTIVLMGLIPIGINIFTLFFPTGRPSTIPLVSLIYSLAVHTQGLLLSYLIWRLYRLADNAKEMTDFTEAQLHSEARTRRTKTDKTEHQLEGALANEKTKRRK